MPPSLPYLHWSRRRAPSSEGRSPKSRGRRAMARHWFVGKVFYSVREQPRYPLKYQTNSRVDLTLDGNDVSDVCVDNPSSDWSYSIYIHSEETRHHTGSCVLNDFTWLLLLGLIMIPYLGSTWYGSSHPRFRTVGRAFLVMRVPSSCKGSPGPNR